MGITPEILFTIEITARTETLPSGMIEHRIFIVSLILTKLLSPAATVTGVFRRILIYKDSGIICPEGSSSIIICIQVKNCCCQNPVSFLMTLIKRLNSIMSSLASISMSPISFNLILLRVHH